MSDSHDRWPQVGAAIATRIEDLGYTKAEVIRESGVSAKTLDGYIAGRPIVRPDKRRELCRALGWSGDSIDAILAGGAPRPLPTEPHELGFKFDAAREIDFLEKRANWSEVEIERLSARFTELESLVRRKLNALVVALGMDPEDLDPDQRNDEAAVTKGPGTSLAELDDLLDTLEGSVSPDPQAAASAEPDDRSADR